MLHTAILLVVFNAKCTIYVAQDERIRKSGCRPVGHRNLETHQWVT